jgi:hypothetical protein
MIWTNAMHNLHFLNLVGVASGLDPRNPCRLLVYTLECVCRELHLLLWYTSIHSKALHWVPIPMPTHTHGFWVGMGAMLLFMGGHGCDIIVHEWASVLRIPTSNSKSESNFSNARNILTKKRSGLKPRHWTTFYLSDPTKTWCRRVISVYVWQSFCKFFSFDTQKLAQKKMHVNWHAHSRNWHVLWLVKKKITRQLTH